MLDSFPNQEIAQITDHYGTQNYIAPNGELVALPLYKLVGDAFALANLDNVMWLSSLANGGTAVVTGGELVISTNTTANGSAIVESAKTARFIGLGPNKFRSLIQLADGGTANNVREWGVDLAVTNTDGAFFRMSGTTFSVVTRKGSADTVVSNGSFNGQYGSTYTFNTLSHNYEVIYQPRQVVFIIDNKILHTVTASSGPWTNTLHLHAHLSSINSGGSTTNVQLKARLAVIARFAIPEAQPTAYFQVGTTAGVVLKIGPGDLHGLNLSAIANNAQVILYDNTAASGTILYDTGTMPANTTPLAIEMHGIGFNTGLTLVIATAAANAQVIYD